MKAHLQTFNFIDNTTASASSKLELLGTQYPTTDPSGEKPPKISFPFL